MHSIQWASSDKDHIDVQFEVKQTSVTMMKPTFQGSPGASGMAAALSLNSVSFYAINLNGGITKSIDGQSQALGSGGSFDISRGQKIDFSATRYGGRSLGEMSAEPAGQPVVYVYLIPPSGRRTSSSKPNPAGEPAQGKAPNAKTSPIQPQQPPAPPKVSDSELKAKQEAERREQLRKKLGIK